MISSDRNPDNPNRNPRLTRAFAQNQLSGANIEDKLDAATGLMQGPKKSRRMGRNALESMANGVEGGLAAHVDYTWGPNFGGTIIPKELAVRVEEEKRNGGDSTPVWEEALTTGPRWVASNVESYVPEFRAVLSVKTVLDLNTENTVGLSDDERHPIDKRDTIVGALSEAIRRSKS